MSITVQVFLLMGTLLILISALGALKFPDTLTRMAAITKASTMGALCFCIAGALHFGDLEIAIGLLASSIILCFGIPVSSHLISRCRVHEDSRKYPLHLKRNDHLEDLQKN
ncbi:cation:proton antiporter [Bdellovibrio sp. HCB209]|uniref:cation:proton antiporter n=1 Tax=Bdellovibrio sp. HCB209 TaxID=3394354 RepID=UPI0039B4AF50